jgi:RNA polymerase sigma-70 factor (ECF subfamily)
MATVGALPAGNVSSELQQCSDEDLARRAQAGSLVAFEELVFRYERRIYGFVLQFCPNAADASEVTQNTFVKAFRNIAQYDSRHAFPGWLFTIARHNCIDHYRAAPPASEASIPDRADSNDPAESLAAQEDRDSLWAVARRVLPPAQFQALWLNYAAEMKVREVAVVLNRTITHVKVMLFRARHTLRRALEETQPAFRSMERGSRRSVPAPNAKGSGPAGRAVKPWAFPADPSHAAAASKLGPIPGT